jgi:cyclomaltodextrinase / maltogenic alpha-amylase / neopullulanase
MSEPDWVHHAIWWQIYPLGFTGADPSGQCRDRGAGLTQVIDYLDYARELGVSGIALGPIFAATSHGYDTADFFRIDERLGQNGDFDQLVEQAHRRGLRILLDGVFNHVGPDFPAFRSAQQAGQAGLFRLDPGAPQGYARFEGHSGLIAFDHDNPAVADLVAEVMNYWLDRGADGWRLDAAYAVAPPFWANVLPRVRSMHPDSFVFGEVIHGDYAGLVQASGFDSVTQYELWKAIWSSFNDGNFFELAWAMRRHNTWLETFVPMTFVGNHDVTRLASRLTDSRHLAHALVVLFTLGGTPTVYYGDEQAWTGVKEERAGGDDAVRAPFPPRAEDLPSAGWATYRLHQQLIGLRRRHPWLHRARGAEVVLRNRQLIYDVSDGASTLRIYLNLDDAALSHEAGTGAVLAGAASVHDQMIEVAPHGWAIVG